MKATCNSCAIEFDYEPKFVGEREIGTHDNCPVCQTRNSNQAWFKQRLLEWDQVCPPLYKLTDPKRLPQDKLVQVLNWDFGPQGLILHGTTGTGKTRAATLLLKQLFLSGRSVELFYRMDFAHQCAKKFGDYEGEDWIDSLVKKDVVFIDDLGKFPLTERVEAELFGLIESRLLSLKPMIITTNFVGGALEAKMTADRGEPLVRRLREFCESVAFV